MTGLPAESVVDETTASKPYAIARSSFVTQCFVVVLGRSSRNTASAAAQLNDRGHIYIESAVRGKIPAPQSFKAQNISNSAFEDRVLLRVALMLHR
jgi:hypothetical protein